MNWDVAHQVAAIAAVQAHRDLGTDRTRYVDIFAALRTAGIASVARPMPRLFGVYIAEADGGPGVLLNACLDIVTQRHTAAHELGHHCLAHRSAYDQELDPSSRWGDGSWPDEEKAAEAFAAWFLMPRPAVLAALALTGAPGTLTPLHAYQVARWLGTSYAGTVRHLAQLRLISREHGRSWLKVQPTALKGMLAGDAAPTKAHVHAIGSMTHQVTVHVDAGDLVVLQPDGARFGPLPDTVTAMPPAGGQLSWPAPETATAIEVTDALTGSVTLTVEAAGQHALLPLTLTRQAPRQGEHRTWPA